MIHCEQDLLANLIELSPKNARHKFRQCIFESWDWKCAYCNKQLDTKSLINGRALTNVGTYRAYIKAYLKNNKHIHSDMTFLVRQLSPTEKGLPIEIYVFSNNTNWIEYEEIQSDIFDHLLSVLNEFELKIYQYPSGNNFLKK